MSSASAKHKVIADSFFLGGDLLRQIWLYDGFSGFGRGLVIVYLNNVSLFNGISTFVGHLMPKPFS